MSEPSEDAMNALIGTRLAALRADLAEGRRTLAELDARRDQLMASMLRIEGAIEALSDLLGSRDLLQSGRDAARRPPQRPNEQPAGQLAGRAPGQPDQQPPRMSVV